MNEKERMYDMLSFTLTEYENDTSKHTTGWETTFYSLLCSIQNNWEMITAEE